MEEHIEPYFEQERLKKSVKAKLAPINDREYNVECALYESISPLMEMTFYAGPRDVAAQMIRTFKSKPDVVYKKILNALLDETHENEK